MATEIRPSLAQLLNPQAAPARPAAQPAPQPTAQAGGFADALAAQKSFFQQLTTPKIAPATYTAADIEKATQTAPAVRAAPVQAQAAAATVDPTQPPRRPGSFLNIVV